MIKLAIVLLAWTALAAPALAAGDDTAAAQAAISVGLKHSKVSGMGAAIIRDRHLAAIAVGGMRQMGKPYPVKPDDLWLIGSDGKSMTAVLILRLVEQHRLSLDAPLPRMDPALAAAARPEYRAITLRQMLSHTSGLPHDYHDMARIIAFYGDRRPPPGQRVAYLGLALTDAPLSPPGKAFH